MGHEREDLPRRGQYGTPIPRCEWCGKYVPEGRMFRQYGTWCSDECLAAGRHDHYTGRLLVSSVVFLITSALVILGVLPVIQLPLTIAGPLLLVAFFTCFCVLDSRSMVKLGAEVRAES